jgi:Sugar kinases, ribokinase family
MILCVGEILADLIGSNKENEIDFKAYAGGAPFNVACNAKFSGAKTSFYGNVGDDVIGRFLKGFVNGVGLDKPIITVDGTRNTTLAFVTIDEQGERSFSFYRKGTADYALSIENIDFDSMPDLKIVHIGSLMLSEPEGQTFARMLVMELKRRKLLFSFDVNFRLDLYESPTDAIARNKWFVENADILKFSDEELLLYTGLTDLEEAIATVDTTNRLFALTMGQNGSMFIYNGKREVVPTEVVRAVDTTGAGDAFYGALLAKIDENGFGNLNGAMLTEIFKFCNKVAAYAVTKHGAINRFDF